MSKLLRIYLILLHHNKYGSSTLYNIVRQRCVYLDFIWFITLWRYTILMNNLISFIIHNNSAISSPSQHQNFKTCKIVNSSGNPVTPLLSWQINKNFDPRTGILLIVRDPQGIPTIPLTCSESSGCNEFVEKFWCVLKKKFQNPTIISWVNDLPP